MRIIDFFDNGASLYPGNIAFVDDDGQITYSEANTQVHRVAGAIRGHGYRKGTHIGILAPNSSIAFVVLLGLFRAEGVWLPINPRNPVAVNVDLLDRFDCEVLFYHSSFAEDAERLLFGSNAIGKAICIDGAGPVGVSLSEWMSGRPAQCTPASQEDDDVFGIFPTGGTTGKSKGVVITHRNIETMFAHMWAHFDYYDNSNHLVVAPMTHTAGLFGCLHFARGGTNTIMTAADPGKILEMIEKQRITHLFLPPTVLYMMLAHDSLGHHDYSSLQHFYVAAAPTSLVKLKQAIDVFGPVMSEVFGQTEAPATITLKAPRDYIDADGNVIENRLSTVGRPGVFNRVAILDPQGNRQSCGVSGEICVQGDLVTPGYYKNPEATAEARQFGWHHTGDIGVMDEEGFIRIVDRMKDMIITGGFNVYPNEIEQLLSQHPAVQNCAVFGIPDDKWGESVKAVIQLKPGMEASSDELIALVKQELGSVKAPKSIDFMAELPRSPVGKVLKTELKKPYWAGRNAGVA